MHIVKRTRWWLTVAVTGFLFSSEALALHVEQLEPHDIDTLHAALQVLEPSISAKKPDGTANVLTWEQLYAPLNPSQRAFVDAFRALNAEALGATSHYFGEEPVTP